MAIHVSITTPQESLSATIWGLGATPDRAIQVDSRPTSYADALRQYRAAKQREAAIYMTGKDIEDNFALDAFYLMLAAPSPDLEAFADKLNIAREEFEGVIEYDAAEMLLADVRRLGGLS